MCYLFSPPKFKPEEVMYEKQKAVYYCKNDPDHILLYWFILSFGNPKIC